MTGLLLPSRTAFNEIFLAMFSKDRFFHLLCLSAAFFILAVFLALIGTLGFSGWPAFSHFGWSFLFQEAWNPVREIYGAAGPLYGTVVTSLFALVLSVPLSFGIAYFLTDLCPARLSGPLGIGIELLAGIPSIIYGLWGFFVLAPLCQHQIGPFLIRFLGPLPFVGRLFEGPPYGIGLLTASLVLAIMTLPFIAAAMRDVFKTISPMVKESAHALGATRSEVFLHIVLPAARTGVTGAIMLGLGRALGETMAVTFVIGGSHRLAASLLAPGTSIAATLASEFNEATSDLYTASLLALGSLLFLIAFLVLAGARLFLYAKQRRIA